MELKHIETIAEFERILTEYSIVIVDYSAAWCGPCRDLEKQLEEKFLPVIKDDPKVIMVKINTDNFQDVVKEEQIEGIPCVMVYHNNEKKRFVYERGGKMHESDRYYGNDPNMSINLIKMIEDMKKEDLTKGVITS